MCKSLPDDFYLMTDFLSGIMRDLKKSIVAFGLFKLMNRGSAFAIVLLSISLFLTTSHLALSGASSSAPSVATVSVPGVADSNNVIFAYGGKYALFAAYAPSATNSSEYISADDDNHFVFGLDTRTPGAELTKTDLRLYYPTTVKFDGESSRVYARGTRYVKDGNDLSPVDSVSYFTLNKSLQPDGGVVTFDIPGVGTTYSTGAPPDLALGRVDQREYLIFASGASIYTFNIAVGYTYQLDLVPPSRHSENYSITNFSFDENNSLLTVVVCGRNFKKGKWQYFSNIFCYRLVGNGTLDLVKQVLSESFPEAVNGGMTAMTPDSNVEISPDGNQAFFVTDDGSICSFELDGANQNANVVRIGWSAELAVTDDENRGPRFIKFDPATNSLSVVKSGYSVMIRRPIFGRPGGNGIRRPIFVRSVESPALLLGQLNKKGRLVDVKIESDFGGPELGISNVVSVGPGKGMIAAYSGNLLSVDFEKRSVGLVGGIGPRANSLTYDAEAANLIAVNSVNFDDTGKMINPGAVAIARLSDDGTPAASLTAVVLSPFSLGGHSGIGIRRPCGLTGR